MKYLLDSNIIIYYLNGDRDIYDFIEKHKSISAISLITYYEVLNYDFSEQEELLVREFLDEFEVLSVSKKVAIYDTILRGVFSKSLFSSP